VRLCLCLYLCCAVAWQASVGLTACSSTDLAILVIGGEPSRTCSKSQTCHETSTDVHVLCSALGRKKMLYEVYGIQPVAHVHQGYYLQGAHARCFFNPGP
jgi:uncharacterized metal-binding protein